MSTLALLALAVLSQADKPAPAAAADPVAALESAVADAIARAEPSVVAITRIKGDNDETTAVRGRNPIAPVENQAGLIGGFPDPMGEEYVALPGDYGTGVIVGDKGEIATTYHLLRGAARIVVRAPGRKRFEAEVIAADPRSDLAVIAPRTPRRDDEPPFRPLALGKAESLRKGSFLVVLGNPYNAAGRDGKASAGFGILSNTARRIEPTADSPGATGLLRNQPSLLQLDAKLNLGLSGGAVVNLKGELVGITTTGGNPDVYDAQAGYAIPMDPLGRRVVRTLGEGREVEYGLLGIHIDPLVPNKIRDVNPGSPAAESELLAGDLVVAVGDRPVNEDDGMSLPLSAVPAGTPVRLTIERDGKRFDRVLTMAKYPVQGPVIATVRPEPWRGVRVEFTSILSGLTWGFEVAQAYAHGGVGIADVETGSPADQAGLKRGQVITSVDGKAVRTPAEFRKAVADRKGPVTLSTQFGDDPVKVITVK